MFKDLKHNMFALMSYSVWNPTYAN